jgi:GTP-binding protein
MSSTDHLSKGMFVDEVDLVVSAGDGGNGCTAFRREKYIPKGGPAGGNGGDGGDVKFRADDSLNTLQHLAGHHHWQADRGGHGEGKNKHGRNGEDCVIRVPPGTLIYDADKGVLLKDLTEPDQTVTVARGGRGGRGNTAFKSPTNQAPREHEDGEPGEQRTIHLELKLIADAGLVGLPNAGKSTLISRISAARPKVAAYPFTTLYPSLGIVELTRFRRFVMADIPGLIEGAHQGAGLGDEFLRHIERTRLLVHMLDCCPMDQHDPAEDYHTIRRELAEYSQLLASKPEIVVANKTDLTGSDEAVAHLRQTLGKDVIAISAVTGEGLEHLGERIWQELHPEED